jgi:hypothetical protein
MQFIKKTLSWDEIQSSHRLMIVLVLSLGLLNFFWGEKVPVGGGFGWDGVRYGNMVRNLDSIISDGGLMKYYAQRILPSFLVRSILLVSKTEMSNINIIRTFELYNLTLLVGACWIWKRVSDNFSLSLAGRWIGFSGIFINFQCSKQSFFYPVLTDVTALFLAMLLLLFYTEKKTVALFLTTIIGSFAWPAVSISGVLLLIFLKVDLPKEVIEPAPPAFTFKSISLPNIVKFSFLVVFILSIIGYILVHAVPPVSENACNFFNNQLQTLANAIPTGVPPLLERLIKRNNPCALEIIIFNLPRLITALPLLFGWLIAFIMLVGSISFFPALIANLRRVRLHSILLAIAAVLIPTFIVKIISNPSIPNVASAYTVVERIFFQTDGKFLLPIVSLAVFWGPLVLLLLLYWKAFCIEARKLGPGFIAIIGLHMILGMSGEPRGFALGWPFFVLGLVLALEKSSTKTSFKYTLAILTILFAQFWMKLIWVPWPSSSSYHEVFKFPQQIYFMHYGIRMNWWSYSIQLVAVILSAVWLHNSVIKVGENKNKLNNYKK